MDCIVIGTEKGVNIYQNGCYHFIDNDRGLKDCNFMLPKLKIINCGWGQKKGYYTIDLDKPLRE
jgi:hypothetical protein